MAAVGSLCTSYCWSVTLWTAKTAENLLHMFPVLWKWHLCQKSAKTFWKICHFEQNPEKAAAKPFSLTLWEKAYTSSSPLYSPSLSPQQSPGLSSSKSPHPARKLPTPSPKHTREKLASTGCLSLTLDPNSSSIQQSHPYKEKLSQQQLPQAAAALPAAAALQRTHPRFHPFSLLTHWERERKPQPGPCNLASISILQQLHLYFQQ